MSQEITVMGAGHQGLAMAAHLSANGVKCNLWNRTYSNIKKLANTKQISVKGVIQAVVNINKVSSNIEEVLTKTIMITTPSVAHRDIARELAKYVDDTYTIILNPGRTFGIVEFRKTLEEAGCVSMPCVAETQTIIYTCRRYEDYVQIYCLKRDVPVAAYNCEDMDRVMIAIPECIREYFKPVASYVETSMGNVGMVLHCLPVLMNVGWIENKDVQFKYYYGGISPTIASILEKLDDERVRVARKLGAEVESIHQWLKRTYNTYGSDLFELLQNNQYYSQIDAPLSLKHRYIEEDIPNGLVPLEAAGKYCGIETPITTTIIDFANMVMNCDFRYIGRGFLL